MRKFLLSTSAIVGVGLIAAPAGAAEKIKIGVSGYAETYVGFTSAEDDKAAAGNAGRETGHGGILTDKEIKFRGSTKLDNGISVSVNIELEGDENATTIDESYVTLSSDTLGLLRVGGDDAAQAAANVSPDKGISNDYNNWIASNVNMAINDNTYDTGNAGDAQKITYFTPRIAGFQLAGSYVPSTSARGTTSPSFNFNTANHSAYSLSLTWKEKVAGVGVNSQVGMYREGHEPGNETGITSGNFGLRLAYQGFDVGFGYLRTMQKGDASLTATSRDGRNFTGSISYKTGPWKAGVYVLESENEGLVNNNNQDSARVYTLFGEYQLSDGVKLQSMVFNVDYDEETNVDANEAGGGWGVVAGMKLDF